MSRTPKTASTSERAQIARLRRQVEDIFTGPGKGHSPSVRLGMGDDCAVLRPSARDDVLVTTDFSLETVHFRRDWHSPESAGHRCLARGLSDLAAMGARPMAAFLSLALPKELLQTHGGRPSWRDRFLSGMLALAQQHRVPLAGGDTAQSPAYRVDVAPHAHPPQARSQAAASGLALADIVLLGSAPRGRALLRSTAHAGDRIYVTGHLGGPAAELAMLAARPKRFSRLTVCPPLASPVEHPHLFPQPRLAIGQFLLSRRLATAAIDISDGLSTDLDHLCEESGLAAIVDADSLPIHPLALAAPGAFSAALHGGEEYELLFTANARTRLPRRIAGVPITCIGEMIPAQRGGPRMRLRTRNGQRSTTVPLRAQGWEHYAAV
jgi:thiamine-monophosphate kinase